MEAHGENKTVLRVEHISKTYTGVKALKDVSMEIAEGEIVALCGENGAGKSTLVKYIAGLHDADPGGSMTYLGEACHFKNALEAKRAGICLVFQEISLMTDLTIAENICIGMYPKNRLGLVDYKKMNEMAAECLKKLDFKENPQKLVGELSLAKQQLVEIAKALAYHPRLLILDEPTSSLTDKEKNALFDNICRLKEEGVAVIYISHRMDEVFEISDKIIVLRDGELVGDLKTRESTVDDVVNLMIGRTLGGFFYKSTAQKAGDVVMQVNHLSLDGIFHDISFEVAKGEILGLYGLVGAGRSEIVETIFGARKATSGSIRINDKLVTINSTVDAVRAGIALVPENRKTQGLILEASCKENLNLTVLDSLKKGGVVDEACAEANYQTYQKKMSINSPGSWQLCGNLSGGNQQKIVIAKWLLKEPQVLILDEPTKGIDVASKSEIHKLIAEIAGAGMAVIVISSEMPEIMGISNRILTIAEGEITGELTGDDITEENIMRSISMQKSRTMPA